MCIELSLLIMADGGCLYSPIASNREDCYPYKRGFFHRQQSMIFSEHKIDAEYHHAELARKINNALTIFSNYC